MKTKFCLLLFVSIVFGGDDKKNHKSTEQTKPTPTSNEILNDEDLCDCYQVDAVSGPLNIGHETCYFYILDRISDDAYCDPMEYLSLLADNLDECNLQTIDIKDLLYLVPDHGGTYFFVYLYIFRFIIHQNG